MSAGDRPIPGPSRVPGPPRKGRAVAALLGAVECQALATVMTIMAVIGSNGLDRMFAVWIYLVVATPAAVLGGAATGALLGRPRTRWGYAGAGQVLACLLAAAVALGLAAALESSKGAPPVIEDRTERVSDADLVAELAASDPDRRLAAADEIVRRGLPGAAVSIVPLLRDASLEVRMHAASCLGRLRDPAALEPLLASLRDGDAGVRIEALRALGRIGDDRALSAMVGPLDAPVVGVVAAEALGELGDVRAAPALIAFLERAVAQGRDGDAERAASSLRRLTGRKLGTDPGAWRKWLAANGPGGG